MQSMNISLPEPLKQFVDAQIAQGRYGSTREYMRELIRADEKLKAEEQLEAKLLQGMQGPRSKWTAQDMKDIRKQALARIKKKGKKN
jgi:antitoxin ParD1/3/4